MSTERRTIRAWRKLRDALDRLRPWYQATADKQSELELNLNKAATTIEVLTKTGANLSARLEASESRNAELVREVERLKQQLRDLRSTSQDKPA